MGKYQSKINCLCLNYDLQGQIDISDPLIQQLKYLPLKTQAVF